MGKGLLYVAACLVIGAPSLLGEGVSADSAESVFSEVRMNSRISDREWQQTVGSQSGTLYTVRRGDSLWSISNRLFQTPYLWAKLWEVNRHISNPHQIEPGLQLSFQGISRRDLASLSQLVPTGQHVKLSPNDMSVSQLNVVNRFRPNLILLQGDEKVRGKVTGAYKKGDRFSEGDSLYVKLKSLERARVGDRFSVVSELPSGEENKNDTLVKLVGEVQIESFGEALALAKVVRTQDSLKREDILIPSVEPVALFSYTDPPESLTATIMMGETPSKKLIGQGQLIVVDRGSKGGMEVGQLFRVYRDTDPQTKRTSDVAVDYKAEVQIVQTGLNTSIGYVVRNNDPLRRGDRLMANQRFLDPPPPPKRELQILEID